MGQSNLTNKMKKRIGDIKLKIVNSALALNFISWSKRTTLPGFRKISLYDVASKTNKQIIDDDIWERTSAISYNFAMAFPPAIIFLFTLIPYMPISSSFIYELRNLIKDIIPGPENHSAIIQFLDDFVNNPRNDLLSFGFLLSLFFTSNAIIGVMRSFDKSLPGFIKRTGFAKRIAAIKTTLVVFMLFFICLALIIAREVVLKWLGIQNEAIIYIITNLRWVLILLLFFITVSYIYRSVPSVDKKWRMLTPGSVVATILMLICAFGFSWWVSNFGNYNKLYGSIGTLIIMSVLIYLISLSLLIGFEINVSIYTLAKWRGEQTSNITAEDVVV